MNVIYKGKEYNLEAEHIVFSPNNEFYMVEHPETGVRTKLIEYYVDGTTPLARVCAWQDCGMCLASRRNILHDESCVYGKYAGYPTEYFIL